MRLSMDFKSRWKSWQGILLFMFFDTEEIRLSQKLKSNSLESKLLSANKLMGNFRPILMSSIMFRALPSSCFTIIILI